MHSTAAVRCVMSRRQPGSCWALFRQDIHMCGQTLQAPHDPWPWPGRSRCMCRKQPQHLRVTGWQMTEQTSSSRGMPHLFPEQITS